DFFAFLEDEPEKDYYLALGSRQRVPVKAKFQSEAKKAYNRCLEAIDSTDKSVANKKWREVFGTSVPLAEREAVKSYRDTKQFIEHWFPVDITATVSID